MNVERRKAAAARAAGAGHRPRLAIVVDTEEEFDWRAPFSRASTSTRSLPAQTLAQSLYDDFGIVPTYVLDYPVAAGGGADLLGRLADDGKAEIGAHLHPWVNPPHDEAVTQFNSYQCNLPPALETAKIEVLTETIAARFGRRPKVFKAGRYGFGPATREALIAQGYEVDCSYVPHVSFAVDGGPDYRGTPDAPFWLDEAHRLLEVPLTSGFVGRFASRGADVASLFDSRAAGRLRLPGLLARTGLLARVRLTPENVTADEQCRLIDTLAEAGRTVFTLTYHSPSLVPGNTPYVRSQAELDAFLERIAAVLRHFRDVHGGAFTTLTRLRGAMLAEQEEAAAPELVAAA
jgi:hypothetical protein